MKVVKLLEAGISPALYGFSLSYRKATEDKLSWWNADRQTKIHKTAIANAARDKGHNKFLEHIILWLSVTATLEWWKQYDTYRIGVSKQSESTMHTLDFSDLSTKLFDINLEEFASIEDSVIYLKYLDMLNRQSSRLKSKAIPQAFMQEREMVLSYKVIRHIQQQRFSHKLPDWISFLDETIKTLDNPELLGLEESS